ncbi:hypothetical protein [Lysinibacillus sp. CNPSo 3705]|uniref:hypothetical protein n=1 Tax=Lysinibacillus sp. CNPSo 3705 TaxID=3028148 RepID=UPI002363E49A|nr:hypothetical protein [Lysinibacillus sp. CNPSo 3705]
MTLSSVARISFRRFDSSFRRSGSSFRRFDSSFRRSDFFPSLWLFLPSLGFLSVASPLPSVALALLSVASTLPSVALALLSVASTLPSVARISFRRFDSSFRRSGSSFRRSGSSFRRSGSSFRRSGSSFRRSDFFPSLWLFFPPLRLKTILKEDPQADILQIDQLIYIKASDQESLKKGDFIKEDKIGEIKKRGHPLYFSKIFMLLNCQLDLKFSLQMLMTLTRLLSK